MSGVTPLHELGIYTLAGGAASSRVLIDEVREAEAMGLGSVFISERWKVKEACALCRASPRSAITSTRRCASRRQSAGWRRIPMATS